MIKASSIKKLCWIISTISLVFVLTFFLIQKNSKELDQNRMALIDETESGYVFRGNNPFVKKNGEKVFAREELTADFNKILSQRGLTTLNDYYLINISLLDLDEYYEMEKEKKFFAQNPEYGEAINISTLSLSLLLKSSPNSNFAKNHIIKNYNLWVTDTLNQIRQAQETAAQKINKPVVIYIHCDSGRDRTGFIAASYRMLFNNKTLSEVRSQNVSESGRNSRSFYNQAMFSYCLHLKQTLGKPEDYCAISRHQ